MSMRCRYVCVGVGVLLVALGGCEKKDATAGNAQGATVSAESIKAVHEALVRDELAATHTGKKCVVMAHMPAGGFQPAPPPPPPGMVRLLGQTIIYSGQFDAVSADSLTVRAAYPTAGNFKRIDIPKEDIQSCHLAP
jgi:hypothetical protein